MDKKNKSLQDIITNYQDIEMKLIESEGEIDQELDSLLSINESELSDKLNGYEKFIRYLKGQMNYLKSMEDLYVKRRRILDNSVQKCRQSMVNALAVTGKKNIKTKEFSFTVGRTEQWEVNTDLLSEDIKNVLIEQGCAENTFKLNLNKFKIKYKQEGEEVPEWININENLFIRVS